MQVAESLETGASTHRRRKDVVEIEVALTPKMREIQTSILECIELCMRELRKFTHNVLDLEDEEWAVENAISDSFFNRISAQLSPIRHRLSFRTKVVLNDLRTLRELLDMLITNDCVTFWKHLDSVVSSSATEMGQTKTNSTYWLYSDAANVVVDRAKQRVYKLNRRPKDATAEIADTESNKESWIPKGISLVLEEQPKWDQLALILDEITSELFANPQAGLGGNGAILIMCSEYRTTNQIARYLSSRGKWSQDIDSVDTEGDSDAAREMLKREFKRYLDWKRGITDLQRYQQQERQQEQQQAQNARRQAADASRPNHGNNNINDFRGRPPTNKRRRTRGGSAIANSVLRNTPLAAVAVDPQTDDVRILTDGQASQDISESDNESEDDIIEIGVGAAQDYYELLDISDAIAVHKYDGDLDDALLEELQPRYIIMYEPDPAFIRRIEVYRAANRDRNLKVYFMYYGDSVEEQRYLSAVRREKDAFSKIIRERGVRLL